MIKWFARTDIQGTKRPVLKVQLRIELSARYLDKTVFRQDFDASVCAVTIDICSLLEIHTKNGTFSPVKSGSALMLNR